MEIVLFLFVVLALKLSAGEHKEENAPAAEGVAFCGVGELGSSFGGTPCFNTSSARYNVRVCR